jgi:hypothetical protein
MSNVIMYALQDKIAGYVVPNSGNPLTATQKAVYGSRQDAEKVAALSNQKHKDRFIVVEVNIFPVDTQAEQE